jgi:hypothetical protein
MKLFKLFMSIMALAIVMAACSKDHQFDSSQPVNKGITKASVGQNGPNYVALYAGQNTYVGVVSFNEYTSGGVRYMEVCYEIEEPWLMTQFHFDIKDIPVNPQGSPQIGQFDYTGTFDPGVSEHCFIIDLDAAGLECEANYAAAAHAVVVMTENDVIISQTAWGEGTRFRPKGSWAMQFQIYMDECGTDITECYQYETAFGGEGEGTGNAWWFYFNPSEGMVQTIYAGQTIEVGTVTYDGTSFVIVFADDWDLKSGEPQSVKAQGYNTLPNKRPVAGLFTLYKGNELTFPASGFNYYVIHLDVQKVIPCP